MAILLGGWDMKPIVLIFSADLDFFLLLEHILDADGFVARLVDDVDETLQQVANQEPVAVMLDCQPDSFRTSEICGRLKQHDAMRRVPVIALIGQGAERQLSELLKLELDENFVRPFSPAKLIEYLRGLLVTGRTNRIPVPYSPDKVLRVGDIEMQLDTYRVARAGRDVRLGPIEFQLLRHFLEHPGRVFSREELIDVAWPAAAAVSLRTVDVHIGRLRRMLQSSGEGDMIRTVRSAGYSLDGQPSL